VKEQDTIAARLARSRRKQHTWQMPEIETLPASSPVYASWDDYLARTTPAALAERCSQIAKRMNRKRLLSEAAKVRGTSEVVWSVLSAARGHCAHCGSLAVEHRPSGSRGAPVAWAQVGRRIGSLEHKRARFDGGDNDIANLAWCCLWCNTWKNERRWQAMDHGGFYPDLSVDLDPRASEAVMAAIGASALRPRPAWLDDVEDGFFEMFPDHECPWDIAMLRQ
jgi:hypothetical protein